MYSKACSLLWSAVKLGLLFVIVAAPAGGGGGGSSSVPALPYTVNNLGTTNSPACNFNLGYICLWTQTANSTLTVSNIPGTSSAPAIVTLEISAGNNGASQTITAPATFLGPQSASAGNYGALVLYTSQKGGGGNALNTFSFTCDGTNCFQVNPNAGFQVGTLQVGTESVAASLQISSGAANGLNVSGGSLLSVTGGTAPTLTAGCNGAGSSVAASATDNAGTFTSQTAAATTCTLTFNHTWPQAPHCFCGDANASTSPVACSAGTMSTTTAVFDFASTASRVWAYHCL
jgi:hypothetical protein